MTQEGHVLGAEFEHVKSPVTGRTYRVQKVWPVDLARDGALMIPGVEAANELKDKVDAGEALDEFEAERVRLFMAALLIRGLRGIQVSDESPMERVRLLDRPADQCPPGTLSIDDFSPEFDRDFLVAEICRLSGLGAAANAEQESVVSREPRAEDTFRAEEGAAGDGGAPNGECAHH